MKKIITILLLINLTACGFRHHETQQISQNSWEKSDSQIKTIITDSDNLPRVDIR